MSDPFPIWSTKWCLSSGIEEATAWDFPGNKEWCVVASGRLRGMILQSSQWHRTKTAAVKEANKVLARVKQQQRDRLEELDSIVFEDGGDSGNGNAEGNRRGDHPDDGQGGICAEEGHELFP